MDINPLAAPLAQSTQVQRQQSAEKQRQLRHAQAILKNVAARDEELEHQVESAEELPPVHDDQPAHEQHKQRKRAPRDGEIEEDAPPHLDLTA